MEDYERVERELLEQCGRVATLAECFAWTQRCDECVESLEELCRTKHPRLAVGHRQFAVARIARLAGARTQLERRFVHVCGGGDDRDRSLAWREIDAAFERRILTGAVINFEHIEPRQFLEDAGSVVLERVRGAIERHGSVKVNTAFNGEFIAGDKRTVMSINSKNCELYPASNVREWEKHVNLLYVQDGDTGHFVTIKHLSRLVGSQLSKKEHKKFFCDRCLHYFSSNEKLEIHSEDCGKLNKCAIRLPSEEKKWLEFRNYGMKERAPCVVYADLECVLRKTEDAATSTSSYAYQQHEVFSIGYYMRCSYDDTLSRNYIELNTQFRTRAKNDFEKNLYKLMNNAVFGKTMENVRDRVDVKLVTTWDGRYGVEALIAKPNFHSRSVFAENLIAVELRKLEVKFDKSIYVGMCILDTI
ncbi:hypothetical protein ALC62_03548 [Cyphomyrmex costatus]|uniref:DNA-directed DNA polymerase n=1 Tax=Cyphomyrmex costatus TaxID=456900 RepID=A0A151ILK5_9HYME|nr:hypothetical protein ALC62_03548 [Cyphomyrmex costatus]